MKNNIVTRFAPSPTGVLHVGGARTALFNFLYTRKHEGKFILRIEDTDKERSKKEYEDNIHEGLEWLGIKSDEMYIQSERLPIYMSYCEKLLNGGAAYEQEDGAIRFRNPGKVIEFNDLVHGRISIDTTELGDFVIARKKDDPLYHLAVVVDDNEMKVSHVIRGEDGIYNTPRQILIQEAIGAPRPIYAHIPFILGGDRSKLSKRHGAISLLDYRDMGYLPDAMINFLALLGWHPRGDKEIFSLDELIYEFDLERVQKAGAIFNGEKLDWINKEYMRKLSPETIRQNIERYISITPKILDKLVPLLMERIHKFSDIKELSERGELSYYADQPKYTRELLKTAKFLPGLIAILETLSEDSFLNEDIKLAVWEYATTHGRGDVLWPMRVALTGKEKSPDPFVIAEILGKQETLVRLRHACQV